MKVEKLVKSYWMVTGKSKLLARIFLDMFHQVEYLVMFSADLKIQRQIKELVLNHAYNYVKDRRYSCMGGLLIKCQTNRDLTENDSDYLMDFNLITEEIKKLDDVAIDAALKGTVEVIQAKYESPARLVESVLKEIETEHGCKIKVDFPDTKNINEVLYRMFFQRDMVIRFTVASPLTFKFWKTVFYGYSDNAHLLHVVPHYHPEFKHLCHTGMVNGDTDAYIGQHEFGIDSIYSPPESRLGRERSLFSSWSHLKHPFYAQGQSFEVKINTIKLISQEAYDCLKKILLASLNINDNFIVICGGFNPPYHYPVQAYTQSEIRGSEHSCVWEYRQLQEENALAGSIIPTWFLKEKWLQHYPEK